MNNYLAELITRIRPMPLAAAAARISGMSKRRPVRTDNGVFWLNPVTNLGRALQRGPYEPALEATLRKYLYPGAVFIDLGANEGYFTVIASGLVGPSGQVIAIEPQFRLQSVIAANLALNNCFNVRLARAVVAGRTEPVELSMTSEINSGASSLFPATKYRLPTEAVQGYTLADFLNRCAVGGCELMKVDIEGAEYDVFMAAGDVLRSGIIRTIAIEFHPRAFKRRGLSQNELGAFIESCGYVYLGDSLYRHSLAG